MANIIKKIEKPLYKQLEEILKQKILKKEYPIDKPIPSENKLCIDYKISRPTVRNAISELIRQKYLCSRPGIGTFVLLSNLKVKSDKYIISKPTYNIALIYENEVFLECPSALELLKGIREGLKYTKYNLIMPFSKNDLSYSVFSLCKKLVSESKADGYILLSVSPDIQRWFEKQNVPVVICGDVVPGLNLPYYSTEQFKINYEATKYLIKLGHRRIALVSIKNKAVGTIRRESAYYAVLKKENIKVNRDIVFKVKENQSEIKKVIRKLLKVKPRPTAIIFHNDYMANFGLMELREQSIRVPEDISIVAGDGSIISEQTYPKLTSFECAYEHEGRSVMEMMLDILKKCKFSREHKIKVNNTRLIIRESCR